MMGGDLFLTVAFAFSYFVDCECLSASDIAFLPTLPTNSFLLLRMYVCLVFFVFGLDFPTSLDTYITTPRSSANGKALA